MDREYGSDPPDSATPSDYRHYLHNSSTQIDSTFPILSSRKRPFSHPAQQLFSDGGGSSIVKVYVAGIPRTATEQDIRSLFGEHGNIVEVVLLKDRRTGQQLESCFVKYSKLEEADLAIKVLNNQNIFPGIVLPLKVRYADTGKGRLGFNTKQPICVTKAAHSIGSSIKETSLQDIRGGAGLQISKLYVAGIDKHASKREIEEVFSSFGLVHEVFILYDEMKQSRGRAFIQFSHRDMAVAAINALNGVYTMRGCDQPLVVRFADPKKPKMGDTRGNYQFGGSGFSPCSQESFARPAPPATSAINPIGGWHTSEQSSSPSQPARVTTVIKISREEDECDWSEHVCPDGYSYFYNSLTCESRWEKPEEYSLYEQQLQKPKQQQQCQNPFPINSQGVTSPVLASPCC